MPCTSGSYRVPEHPRLKCDRRRTKRSAVCGLRPDAPRLRVRLPARRVEKLSETQLLAGRVMLAVQLPSLVLVAPLFSESNRDSAVEPIAAHPEAHRCSSL